MFECCICPLLFEDRDSRFKHRLETHPITGENGGYCVVCRKHFFCFFNFTDHFERNHPKEARRLVKSGPWINEMRRKEFQITPWMIKQAFIGKGEEPISLEKIIYQNNLQLMEMGYESDEDDGMEEEEEGIRYEHGNGREVQVIWTIPNQPPYDTFIRQLPSSTAEFIQHSNNSPINKFPGDRINQPQSRAATISTAAGSLLQQLLLAVEAPKTPVPLADAIDMRPGRSDSDFLHRQTSSNHCPRCGKTMCDSRVARAVHYRNYHFSIYYSLQTYRQESALAVREKWLAIRLGDGSIKNTPRRCPETKCRGNRPFYGRQKLAEHFKMKHPARFLEMSKEYQKKLASIETSNDDLHQLLIYGMHRE